MEGGSRTEGSDSILRICPLTVLGSPDIPARLSALTAPGVSSDNPISLSHSEHSSLEIVYPLGTFNPARTSSPRRTALLPKRDRSEIRSDSKGTIISYMLKLLIDLFRLLACISLRMYRCYWLAQKDGQKQLLLICRISAEILFSSEHRCVGSIRDRS